MITYRVGKNGILKLIDGVAVQAIPKAEGNSDYREFLEWEENGGVPEVQPDDEPGP